MSRHACYTTEDALRVLGRTGAKPRDLSDKLGISIGAANTVIQRLRTEGLISSRWGDYRLTEKGQRQLPQPAAAPPAPPPVAPITAPSTVPAPSLGVAEYIEALQLGQDALLTRANAQLRLRVTELEGENRDLRARLRLMSERVAFAAEAACV